MLKRQSNRSQLKLRWEVDNSLWNRMEETQQRLCRELLSQLLLITASNENERIPSDEREDSSPTS